LTTLCSYPVRGLDLTPFVINKNAEKRLYDLYAVSNHSGGLGGGHYTAIAMNAHDVHWYSFNDSHCSRFSEEEALETSAAYVLFYKLRDDKSAPKPKKEKKGLTLVRKLTPNKEKPKSKDPEESDEDGDENCTGEESGTEETGKFKKTKETSEHHQEDEKSKQKAGKTKKEAK